MELVFSERSDSKNADFVFITGAREMENIGSSIIKEGKLLIGDKSSYAVFVLAMPINIISSLVLVSSYLYV